MQPLIEKRDYGISGLDQLEKQYVGLPDVLQKQVKQQFVDRTKESNMNNVDKIAAEIFAAEEKEAVSPPGWKGTVEHMKKHKDISNPWALAWWMSKKKPGESWGKGGKLKKKPKPHYKEKKSFDERVSAIVELIVPAEQELSLPMFESTKKYSTVDSIKTDDGYINIKSNYDEKNGETLLEEYIVDKNGDVTTYNDIESFTQRLMSEGLL